MANTNGNLRIKWYYPQELTIRESHTNKYKDNKTNEDISPIVHLCFGLYVRNLFYRISCAPSSPPKNHNVEMTWYTNTHTQHTQKPFCRQDCYYIFWLLFDYSALVFAVQLKSNQVFIMYVQVYTYTNIRYCKCFRKRIQFPGSRRSVHVYCLSTCELAIHWS